MNLCYYCVDAVMRFTRLLLVSLAGLIHRSLSELGFVENTDTLSAVVRTRVSREEHAISTGTVLIVFYGSRSSSPTMVLGHGFKVGDNEQHLDFADDLGELRKVRLVANSTDGVLFNSISVEMRSSQQGLGSALYTFAPIQFWLDLAKLDAVPEKRYEPGAPSGGPRYSREVIELAVESSSIALR